MRNFIILWFFSFAIEKNDPFIFATIDVYLLRYFNKKPKKYFSEKDFYLVFFR